MPRSIFVAHLIAKAICQCEGHDQCSHAYGNSDYRDERGGSRHTTPLTRTQVTKSQEDFVGHFYLKSEI